MFLQRYFSYIWICVISEAKGTNRPVTDTSRLLKLFPFD